MNVKKTGEYMDRHPKTVLHLLHTGQLVGFQASGRNGTWRIHRDDIDQFMRNPQPRKRRRLRTA